MLNWIDCLNPRQATGKKGPLIMKPSQDRIQVTFDEAGAAQMDRTAAEVFAPIYPILAEQIVRHLGITKGLCVDIGSGPGSLALALASITKLRIILLDAAMPMHMRARRHVSAASHGHRCTLLRGDVHHMPIRDNTVHLMVSRGSLFFWTRPERAFSEIHRVLSPSGRTYIGGGFGSALLRDRICEKMEAIRPGWKAFRDQNFGELTRRKFISALAETALHYDIINDDSGFWIIIKKE
jgi:SAM-dependent methyltransferase